MNIKKMPKKIISQVINDLVERGAKITVIFYNYPNFIIKAKWSTGRLWHIGEIQHKNS